MRRRSGRLEMVAARRHVAVAPTVRARRAAARFLRRLQLQQRLQPEQQHRRRAVPPRGEDEEDEEDLPWGWGHDEEEEEEEDGGAGEPFFIPHDAEYLYE